MVVDSSSKANRLDQVIVRSVVVTPSDPEDAQAYLEAYRNGIYRSNLVKNLTRLSGCMLALIKLSSVESKVGSRHQDSGTVAWRRRVRDVPQTRLDVLYKGLISKAASHKRAQRYCASRAGWFSASDL